MPLPIQPITQAHTGKGPQEKHAFTIHMHAIDGTGQCTGTVADASLEMINEAQWVSAGIVILSSLSARDGQHSDFQADNGAGAGETCPRLTCDCCRVLSHAWSQSQLKYPRGMNHGQSLLQ